MKKFWNIAFIIFFILLIPLAPILWLLKEGKGVSDEEYKKMEEDKQRMLMSSGLITFF